MARHRGKRPGKGTFSELRLPVAKQYLHPPSRYLMLGIGGLFFAAILGLAIFNFKKGEGSWLSKGPLSSNHANLEGDCSACHTPAKAVPAQVCSACHEKFGDSLGVFSFSAHYLYRSTDFQRVVPSEHETACSACHGEHGGREAEITRVPDARCLSCHDFGSFNRRHPPFEAVTASEAQDGSLKFAHIHHVRELLERNGWGDVEKACLSCHQPQADGKTFKPLSFDDHCDDCHLPATLRTKPLPLLAAGERSPPGVEALASIQQSGRAGTRWAFFLNPGEFRRLGDRIVKGPLYHRDPWVLYNLRSLRRRLFPQAGLADLLTGSADIPERDLLSLYAEALETLETHALELRSRPEPQIQAELKRIEDLLGELEARLEDPYAPLDETKFLLALGPPAENLSEGERKGIDSVVADLTEACRQCHRVEDATIVRVQENRRWLERAEFNHRAHILDRRCLDCHQEIPILENLGTTEAVDPALDHAGIINLPRIEQCQECHNPQTAANTCVTCHEFHPQKGRRSDLLLYLDKPPESEGQT